GDLPVSISIDPCVPYRKRQTGGLRGPYPLVRVSARLVGHMEVCEEKLCELWLSGVFCRCRANVCALDVRRVVAVFRALPGPGVVLQSMPLRGRTVVFRTLITCPAVLRGLLEFCPCSLPGCESPAPGCGPGHLLIRSFGRAQSKRPNCRRVAPHICVPGVRTVSFVPIGEDT